MKLITFFAMLFSAVTAFAQAEEPAIGRVASLRGAATVRHAQSPDLDEPLAVGTVIRKSDVLVTGPASSLRILMQDKSLLDLGERSRVSLLSYGVKNGRRESASVKVWIGRLWARVSTSIAGEKNFEVTTPNAVAGVRGTRFLVDVSPTGETSVTVEEGAVEFGGLGKLGQLLQALDQGRINLAGEFSGGRVTQSQLNALNRLTRGFGGNQGDRRGMQQQLSQEGLDTPDEEGGEQGQGGAAPSELQSPTGPELPPINLDPGAPLDGGAGTTRIRGRIEVQD